MTPAELKARAAARRELPIPRLDSESQLRAYIAVKAQEAEDDLDAAIAGWEAAEERNERLQGKWDDAGDRCPQCGCGQLPRIDAATQRAEAAERELDEALHIISYPSAQKAVDAIRTVVAERDAALQEVERLKQNLDPVTLEGKIIALGYKLDRYEDALREIVALTEHGATRGETRGEALAALQASDPEPREDFLGGDS